MPSYQTITTTVHTTNGGASAPPRHHLNEFYVLLLQGLGELIGTFFFIFIGLGSVPAAIKNGADTSFLTISLAFGLGLAISVFIFYRISGGVFNPAIAIALLVTGNFSFLKTGVYIAGELIGAQLAGHAVRGLFPISGVDFSLANALNGINAFQGIVAEALLTAPLVLVVYFLAVEKSKVTFLAPAFIGLYVFAAHLVLSPFTGTSLNPARSYAGAIVSGAWEAHYVFWVGPILGALLADGIYILYKKVDYLQLNGGQDAEVAPPAPAAIQLPS